MSNDAAPGPDPASLAARQDFLDFFDTEYAKVVRFMMRCGATLPAAEDAAQQAFEAGWRKAASGEWDQIERPQAWIRTVARNCYLAQHRGPVVISFGNALDRAAPEPGHAELADQARDLIALLQLLDVECRTVFALQLDGVPGPEIAAELGLKPQRVRDLAKRARQELRKHWEGGTHQ